MFKRKKLLKQCSNDKIAISIIKRQRNMSFVKMVLSLLIFFVLFVGVFSIKINSFFSGFCLFLCVCLVLPAFAWSCSKCDDFILLVFDCTEMDYINCVLLDNATIEEFAIFRKDSSYVYILDEYNKIKQIPFCPSKKNECKKSIKIKRYSQLENGVLEEFYEPI